MDTQTATITSHLFCHHHPGLPPLSYPGAWAAAIRFFLHLCERTGGECRCGATGNILDSATVWLSNHCWSGTCGRSGSGGNGFNGDTAPGRAYEFGNSNSVVDRYGLRHFLKRVSMVYYGTVALGRSISGPF